MKRWLIAIVLFGCSKKAAPAPAPVASVDPFDPRVDCRNYVARAEPALQGALKTAKDDDMTNAQALQERALAMGKARGTIGPEPFSPEANAHYKRSIKTLDGLASGLSTLAASREPGAPKNPELQLVAQKVMSYRKDLEDVVKAVPTTCP